MAAATAGAAVAGRDICAADDAGGTGGGGAAEAARGAAAPEATGAAADIAEGGGAPGARVGNLMVGAEVGLGGKLMRTVSFFGCTLPVDFFNGSAPVGAPGNGLFGGRSAIVF